MGDRIGRIISGFLMASIAVGAVFTLVVFARTLPAGVEASKVLGLLLMASMVAAVVSSVPSVIAIAVAEWFRIRNPWYFAAAGGSVSPILFALSSSTRMDLVSIILMFLLGVLGMFGGWIYWQIAGRESGVTDAGKESITDRSGA